MAVVLAPPNATLSLLLLVLELFVTIRLDFREEEEEFSSSFIIISGSSSECAATPPPPSPKEAGRD